MLYRDAMLLFQERFKKDIAKSRICQDLQYFCFKNMATKQTTVDFILDQLASLSGVRARKMFGEYTLYCCLLYTSPSPRDRTRSRMPSSA